MNIFSKENKKVKFTVIDNGYVQDRRLSLSARGLLTVILTIRNISELTLDDVAYYVNGGSIQTRLRKVRALCTELEQYGYCVVSKGKDSKGRFASNYDFYEVPNQPPPIAVRSNVAAFSKPSRNTEAATENPTEATADGKPQTENRNVKPTTDNCDGLYIYSIKRKDKRKEENKVKNPLTHTRARENFEIKNIAVAANEKYQTSTPPTPPPPQQASTAKDMRLWEYSGYAPTTKGGKEKFIIDAECYMLNFANLAHEINTNNFDFNAFYFKCDTVFSNERATEGLAKRHRSDDFAKTAVTMLLLNKNGKQQYKDFLISQNKLNNDKTNQRNNNGFTGGAGNAARPTFGDLKKAFGI